MTDKLQKLTRSFIAAPITPEVKQFIQAQITELKQAHWAAQVRWSKPENIHLTLRFLGDLTANKLDELSDSLSPLMQKHSHFEISMYGPDLFPNKRNPRVIALTIKPNNDLKQLVDDIEQQVTSHDITQNPKQFRGHVTLGRVKKKIKFKENLTDNPKNISMSINEVKLYKSVTKQEGAEYTILKCFELQ